MFYEDKQLRDTLEGMLDGGRSVASILTALSEVCHEKAEHIRTNWQDRLLARVWDQTGRQVDKFSAKLPFLTSSWPAKGTKRAGS